MAPEISDPTIMTLPTSPVPKSKVSPSLEEAIQTACRRIPPLWPLSHFVAVNPFLGWSDHHFLDVARRLQPVAHGDMFLPSAYYLEQIGNGRITQEDLNLALQGEDQSRPDLGIGTSQVTDLTSLQSALKDELDGSEPDRVWTFAEHVDREMGLQWNSLIVEEISKWCSVYFDQGQSSWSMPWKDCSLWDAWRQAAQSDLNPELNGLSQFRRFVQSLPPDPRETIRASLEALKIPQASTAVFLHRQLMTISGWSGYVQYLVREKSMVGQSDDSLIGLLGIRMAYEWAIGQRWSADVNLGTAWKTYLQRQTEGTPPASRKDIARYLAMKALENSYQRQLIGQIRSRCGIPSIRSERKQLQAVFCIDVRSEVFRRALEAQSEQIETVGFAGFFGMAVEYIPLGMAHGRAQCPVLLTPKFQIREGLPEAGAETEQKILTRQHLRKSFSEAWRSFQTSAISCFSFVETAGLSYGLKLVSETVSALASVGTVSGETETARVGPQIAKVKTTPSCHRATGLDDSEQLDLAAGALRNMGLTRNFARLVLICGHGSTTHNNPYASGLDCGACGGHAGDVNARVAAQILNQPSVRKGLVARGIVIPEDTLFLAGLHNTTTDEVELFDTDGISPNDNEKVSIARSWLAGASSRCRYERAMTLGIQTSPSSTRDPGEKVAERGFHPERSTMGASSAMGTNGKAAGRHFHSAEDETGASSMVDSQVIVRSRDWAQVRPEWGLAGNAAFIAAPRERTKGLNLGGRTFLHNYDSSNDPDRSILTLIMTAPMVVASWINLQYYASTVNNRLFGSGNKVIHNVVGTFGIWQGNGGDLQTGLPMQSLHDGQRWRHEPIRLTVILEARRQDIQRVLDSHAQVRELVENGWVLLIAMEPDSDRQWRATGAGQWEELLLPTASVA